MQNSNSLPDPIAVNVCSRYDPKQVSMDLAQLQLRDTLLNRYIGSTPNDELLNKQRSSISAAFASLMDDRNFLLADGMGMGKTAQAKVIAELLLKEGKIDRVIVVPAPGGADCWAGFPGQVKTVAGFLKECNTYDPRTLVIIDEIHRFKGLDSIAGTFLTSYGDKSKDIACHCPVLAMSGTLTDKLDEMANYIPLFRLGLKKSSPAQVVLDELARRGQISMRSLEYPNFGLSLSKFDAPLPVLDGLMATSNYDPSVFTYALCLERYYMEHCLQNDISESLSAGRVPVILTSQINMPVCEKPVSEFIATLVQSLGGTPVFLDSHPTTDPVIGLETKKPVLFGTMQSVGTGSNLQDTLGTHPRDLILSGVSFEVNEIIQACYRVLRPNSLSTPAIILPVSEHPVHKFAFGCIAKKLKSHPNTDATFTNVCDFMQRYAPLSSTLRESSLLFLKEGPELTDPLAAMFIKCAGLFPSIKGNKRVFSACDLEIPNYKKVCLEKYKAGEFHKVFGMDERAEHFWISLYRAKLFNPAWNRYIQMLLER